MPDTAKDRIDINYALRHYSQLLIVQNPSEIIETCAYFSDFKKTGIEMSDLPSCPKCSSEYTYQDGINYICPECTSEWNQSQESAPVEQDNVIKDAFGNVLNDGDTVTVIKDLKVKGSSLTVKVGTKVKNIRLVSGDHDIDCRIEGIGAMKLKSQFVKKS
jgi:protein PhnA